MTATTDSGTRVLVIEDAPEFQMLIERALERPDIEVALASTGAQAIERLDEFNPDVVLLDLGLPDMDGLEVSRHIRANSAARVLMLTGRDDEVDLLVGFASGADDYMTKPFSPRELVARVTALARRTGPTAETAEAETDRHCVSIDEAGRRATVDGELIELTKIEFGLLAALRSRPEMVFSRDILVERVWDASWIGNTHVIDVHIANLRKKIDRCGHGHIDTVRGVGYRLAESAQALLD